MNPLPLILLQVHMRLTNPGLEGSKVGSRHDAAWFQMSAEFFEEVLTKGRVDEEDNVMFHAPDNCTFILTQMCKFAIIQHLKTEGVRLQEFSRVLAFFKLDANSLKACEALVSVSNCKVDLGEGSLRHPFFM